MQEYVVIDRDNELPVSQDFNLLREKGIEHLAKLSSRRWSDFNTSDPGITLLEAMCYSITEMGYRTGFSIADLIAPQNKSDESWKCIFYTAKKLLHNSAVTINDYRKLLLDIRGVRNVWIEPSYSYEVPVYVDQDWTDTSHAAPAHTDVDPCSAPCGCGPRKGRLTTLGNATIAALRTLELEGLYNVLIQYEEDVNETAQEDLVRREVLKRLHRNRNLCEDFISVIPVRPQKFDIDCTLILTPEADPDRVLAQVFAAIYRYFSPTVRFYTIDQMLQKPYPHEAGERKYRIEDIFEGPALESGFIDDAELEKTDMFRDIRLSDLLNEIADIPGIRAITRFIIPRSSLGNGFFTDWITELREKRMVAELDIDKCRAVLCKDSANYYYDVDAPAVTRHRVKKLYKDLLARERNYHLQGHTDDFEVPTGKYSDLHTFVPIQNDLPHIYGLHSLHGVPAGANQAVRETQVKQLRGYLILFDQLLADHLAQLANLNRLFSFCDEDHSVFFKTLHDEVDYNLQELFIADKDLLHWKNQIVRLQEQYEEKKGEKSFLKDDIAELKVRTAHLAQLWKQNEKDKSLKYKYQKTSSTLAEQEGLLQLLNADLLQIKENIADLHIKINQAESVSHQINQQFGAFLEKLLDAPRLFVRRRSRMMNHLLARFGEDMSAYDTLMRSIWTDSPIELERRLISDKSRLLKDYYPVGNGRSRGFDYWIPASDDPEKAATKARKKAWGSENISGTERRVSRLLGFSDVTREYLTPSWIEVEEHEQHHHGHKKQSIVHVFTDDAERQLIFKSEKISGGECCIDDFIQLLIDRGSNPRNYAPDYEDRNNKTYHLFTLTDGDNPLGSTRVFNSEQEAVTYRKRLIKQFDSLYNTEGMHLLEHILLRPKTDEVLQFADANSHDDAAPPAEPVKLLPIHLNACDHCGVCCFEIKPVEIMPMEPVPAGTTELTGIFVDPTKNSGSLTVKIPLSDVADAANLKQEFLSAMRHRKNYQVSADKKTLTIYDSDKNPLATVDLSGITGAKKLHPSEIIDKIRHALLNNGLLLSAASPFNSGGRITLEPLSPATAVPASRLQEILEALYELTGSHVDSSNPENVVVTIPTLATIQLGKITGSKDEIAEKVKKAFKSCISIRSYKIRITRLPAEKCYQQEPWVLQISALKDNTDPSSKRVVFYRTVETLGSTLYLRDMKFWQYEHLTDYLGRIRAVANESENYSVLPGAGKFGVVLKNDQGATLAQTDYEFETREAAEKWMEDIRLGFALEQVKDCTCKNCNYNEDPYSYRATVVLPCWSRRFQNKDFRHFTEQTLQLEKPAHVDLQVVWLGMEAMRRFEQTYRTWLIEMVENEGMPELQVVNQMVDVLNGLKNCGSCTEDCSHHHTTHD